MAKHVIYGAFGLLSALAIAAAIYFDKPDSELEAKVSQIERAGSEEHTASVVIAGDSNELYEVTKVIDGDTIIVKIAGKFETIRLIGIDAPETGIKSECFAVEATTALKNAIGSSKVSLEKDPTQGERDKYDRLLAYVFSEGGVNLGKDLVSEGYVKEYTYSKTYKYQKEYKAAEVSAKNSKKGLWAPNACQKSTVIQERKAPVPALVEDKKETVPEKEEAIKEEPEPNQEEPKQKSNSSYECSSNTYNCSDFSTHTEAQTVFEQCGGTSNDIHQLDRDKDGQVCESLP